MTQRQVWTTHTGPHILPERRSHVRQLSAYALSERIADGTIHALGLVLAMTGTVLLITFAALWSDFGALQIGALAVYAAP